MLSWQTQNGFKIEMELIERRCHVTFSGALDWTQDSDLITQCFNQVWTNTDIKCLLLDCRDLSFANRDGVLGTYFLALILEIKTQAREKHLRLFICLKSKKQAAILNLWGDGMWRKFKRHFIFDDPD